MSNANEVNMNAVHSLDNERVAIAVLSLDIVSYSTQFDELQVRLVRTLTDLAKELIAHIPEENKILLPTGDGLIIAFPGKGSTATMDIAIKIHGEISKRLLRLPLRMGLHEGEGQLIRDINNKVNVAGNVMNLCQRVMDVGDEGHILVSESAYLTLKNTKQYGHNLIPLEANPVEVKHGLRINIYTFLDKDAGNQKTPTKIKSNVGLTSSSIGRPPIWTPFVETQNNLKIISHCTRLVVSPDFIETMELAIAERGVNVRILLLNSLSPAFALRSKSRAYKAQHELITTFEYVIRSLHSFPYGLPEQYRNRFDVRLFDAIPTFVGFITDDKAHVSVYVENSLGSKGPFFSCRRQEGSKNLYSSFEDAFDSIWNLRSISIFDQDFIGRQEQIVSEWRSWAESLEVPNYQRRELK